MSFELPKLPYSTGALSPLLSQEAVEIHYGKHHKKYVETLNGLLKGTAFEKSSLEDIIRKSKGELYNQAAQVWNHTFYWHCLSPDGGKEPKGYIAAEMQKHFGGFQNFQSEFTTAALSVFGSGWVWLVKTKSGELEVRGTKDAANPLSDSATPLLVCDVWEHAYYVDFRNERPRYVDAFWKLANWEFVEKQLVATKQEPVLN